MKLINSTKNNKFVLEDLDHYEAFTKRNVNAIYINLGLNDSGSIDCVKLDSSKHDMWLTTLSTDTLIIPITIKEIIFEENQ